MNITITDVSNAIRKNGLEQWFEGAYWHGTTHACAIGQAVTNLRLKTGAGINDVCRILSQYESKCPIDTGCEYLGYLTNMELPVDQIVIHLNDKHRWTFVQIADWLDALGANERNIPIG